MGVPLDDAGGRLDQVYKMISCLPRGKATTFFFPLRQFAREVGQEYTFLWFAFV
jgi:hypothetical protein